MESSRDEKGRLKKGHGGLKPKGATSEKTEQWKVLHESIVNQHAASFNAVLDELLNSDDLDERIMGSEQFLKMLEYFKPKLARQQIVGDSEAPVQIIISDKI